MKKFLLQTAILATTALGAMAETGVVDYSYADGDLFAYGKGKKEVVDVAMCINDPQLKGMKILGFKAFINTIDGLKESSLWMSNNLTLNSSKENVPDIASFDVTPELGYYGNYQLGMMSVTLDEPYVIGDDPIYLGYSLNINDIKEEGQQYPIVCASSPNPNGLFLRLSKSILKWKDYSSLTGGSALIIATIEGEFPPSSLGIQGCETQYAPRNEEFTADFRVSNLGANPVSSIEYTYSVDGGAKTTSTIELDNPISPSLTVSNLISLQFNPIAELGEHTIDVTLSKVNGIANESVASSSAAKITVVPFMPVNRPLVEEYTGLWCGWCPRGWLAMEYIRENYAETSVSICYHSGDAMAVTGQFPMNVSGYPNASVNRQDLVDPYAGSSGTHYGIVNDMTKIMNQFTEASIDVTAELVGKEVKATASVQFVFDNDNADYQIGFVLVCDGLSNSTWAQDNYYAGAGADYFGTPLYELTTWPSKTYGLVFNDVAVDIKATRGIAGSIPTQVKVGETYTADVTYNIANNKLVQDEDNLVVTAFLINKKTGRIVNSNKFKFAQDDAGVSNIAKEEAKVIGSEYYDLTGRRVTNPADGLFIRVDKMDDGTTRTSKIMLNR